MNFLSLMSWKIVYVTELTFFFLKQKMFCYFKMVIKHLSVLQNAVYLVLSCNQHQEF